MPLTEAPHSQPAPEETDRPSVITIGSLVRRADRQAEDAGDMNELGELNVITGLPDPDKPGPKPHLQALPANVDADGKYIIHMIGGGGDAEDMTLEPGAQALTTDEVIEGLERGLPSYFDEASKSSMLDDFRAELEMQATREPVPATPPTEAI